MLCVTVLVVSSNADANETLVVENKDAGISYVLTVDELRQLPSKVLTTADPGSDTTSRFSAVSLEHLTQGAAKDALVTLETHIGFRLQVPLGRLLKRDVTVAFEKDGRLIATRDRGPFRLITKTTNQQSPPGIEDLLWRVWHLSSISYGTSSRP